MIAIKKKDNTFIRILYLCWFFTVLSQMPFFVEVGISSSLSTIIWIVFLIVCLFYNFKIILVKKILAPLILGYFIIIFLLVASVFNQAYIKSALSKPIFISLYMMIIGAMCGKKLKEENIKTLFTAYVMGTLVVVISVFVNYFMFKNTSTIEYLYKSKNSTSQIALTAIIFIIYIIPNLNKGVLKFFLAFTGSIIFVVMILMKSRATLVSIPFIILIILSERSIDKKIRLFIFIIILAISIGLIFNDTFNKFIINDIVFAGRSSSDLDDVSSGRMTQWNTFYSDILKYWLVGRGTIYRESIILAAILSYGIFAGGLVLILAIWPFVFLKVMPKFHKLTLVYKMIAIAYVLNGFFEELAPFGPGVKCFSLWFMIGVFSTFRFNLYRFNSSQLAAPGRK